MNNPYNPQIHHRRSIRLKGYDYSQAGFYFVTICTQDRQHLFGEILVMDSGVGTEIVGAEIDSAPTTNQMVLNDAGKMVSQLWYQIPNNFHNVQLHEFVIMPNHIHGIIEITPISDNPDLKINIGSDPITLPNIIQSFKRHTTIEYIKMVKQNILPPFNKRVWQRNYWEHIIRNQNAYQEIAQYVVSNPLKWTLDELNRGQT